MKNSWWMLFSICLLVFLFNLDITVVNIALAPVAKQLDVNLREVQWVPNIYLATAGIDPWQ